MEKTRNINNTYVIQKYRTPCLYSGKLFDSIEDAKEEIKLGTDDTNLIDSLLLIVTVFEYLQFLVDRK
jgi:hypothetical protein